MSQSPSQKTNPVTSSNLPHVHQVNNKPTHNTVTLTVIVAQLVISESWPTRATQLVSHTWVTPSKCLFHHTALLLITANYCAQPSQADQTIAAQPEVASSPCAPSLALMPTLPRLTKPNRKQALGRGQRRENGVAEKVAAHHCCSHGTTAPVPVTLRSGNRPLAGQRRPCPTSTRSRCIEFWFPRPPANGRGNQKYYLCLSYIRPMPFLCSFSAVHQIPKPWLKGLEKMVNRNGVATFVTPSAKWEPDLKNKTKKKNLPCRHPHLRKWTLKTPRLGWMVTRSLKDIGSWLIIAVCLKMNISPWEKGCC